MAKDNPKLRGWSFDVTEVSAGVYRVLCHDRAGRNIEVTGLDPDALLEECKQAALDMMAEQSKLGECGFGVTKGG